MDLPVMPPVAPMLAKSVKEVPAGPGYLYEPKWDGFRCIVFRDGDEVELGSRNERPMTRYFPEVVDAVRAQLPERCVVDAEIVVPRGDRLDFEALLQRIHPADSRVRLLAEQTPASLVAFDLLALGDESLMDTPLAERRRRLDEVLANVTPPVHRTLGHRRRRRRPGVVRHLRGRRARRGRRQARRRHVRAGQAGDAQGQARAHRGLRGGRVPLAQERAGGRLAAARPVRRRRRSLQHVGVVASFPMARRAELVQELAPWRENALDGHPWRDWAEAQAQAEGRMPGAQSRWNAKKDLSWEPLRAERVVEVRYDHMEGTRFRHTTQFVRWRDDRDPRSCTYEQLDEPVSYDLAALLR